MDYDYCPQCDKLVQLKLGVCTDCKQKTVRFKYKIESKTALVAISIVGAVVLQFVLVFLLEFWIALLLILCAWGLLMLANVKYMMRTMRNVADMGRELYDGHKKDFNSEEGLDLRKGVIYPYSLSWNIRHVSGLLVGIIICSFMGIILFFHSSLSVFFIVVAIILYIPYRDGRKLKIVITALEKEIIEANSERWHTLRINTYSFGEFFVFWRRKGPRMRLTGSSACYYVWIHTSKEVTVEEGWKKILWERPSSFRSRINVEELSFSGLVSPHQLEEINNIFELRYEIGEEAGKIVGILSDKAFRSEIQDILKTVTLLRGIEARL